jgi:outer membrane protein, heavy metal efflux system
VRDYFLLISFSALMKRAHLRSWLIGLGVFAWALPAVSGTEELPSMVVESETGIRQHAQHVNWIQVKDLIKRFNAEVLAARAQIRAAEANILIAKALPNPEIDFEMGQLRRRVPEAIPGNTQRLSVAQTLENPALRTARVHVAHLGEKAAAKAYLSVLNDVLSEGRARLYELVLRQAEVRSASESLTLLEQVRDRVALRVKSGESPRFELVKSDTEVLNARQRVETARSLAAQSRVALEILTGGAFPDQFILDARLDDSVVVPLIAPNVEGNPAVLQLEFELRQMLARVEQERALRWPGVTVRIGQSREPDVNSLSGGVVLTMPLLDQRQGAIAEAEAQASRLRIRREGLLIQLKQEIESARQALILAQRKVLALETGVLREARTALNIAQTAYQFGERGLLDVLDAQRVLRVAQADLLGARYEVQLASIQVERLQGIYVQDLTEISPS